MLQATVPIFVTAGRSDKNDLMKCHKGVQK
jgi:hypothetical protein